MNALLSPRLFALMPRIRLQHAMIVLCTIVVLSYGGSAFVSLWRGYHQVLNEASTTLERIARAAEASTNRSLFETDAALLGVNRTIEALLPDAALDSAAVKTLLRQFNDQTLAVRDIVIIDDKGWLTSSADPAPAHLRYYAEQPFFAAHRGGVGSALYIGPPQRSHATGGWSIMMSRKLIRGDAMAGVIAAEVPIGTFAEFFNSLVANTGIRARLLLDDGTLIASEPHRDDLIGRRTDFAAAVAAAAPNPTGILATVKDGSGNLLLGSFRRVPSRPLIVAVARERADILRQWHADLLAAVVAFLLFAVTVASLTWVMVRTLVHQQLATTELEASEEQLKRQSALLQSTLESMGEGLSVFDRHGRLIAWNSRFIELLDLPSNLDNGVSLHEILMMQARRGDFGAVDPAVNVAERVERFYVDLPAVRERMLSSGRTLQIRRRAMPDGGVVSLYSDITERKNSEEKMAQAWAQAELANRSKSDFLANMSHELRTPLNAIVGFSEIISSEHLGPLKHGRYLEYSQDIHASGLHLLSIINDVLDMSKIEAGKLEIHEQEVEVKPLLDDAQRMVVERAQKQNIDLVCHAPDFNLVIWADERALKQALLNLLSNAVKFSGAGGRVTIEAALDRDNAAVFTVTDAGIGMSPEDLERALQPFGQAQSSTTRTHGGTGLGLPISQGLVEAHGGTLQIESSPGRGTVARIRLPADRTRAMRLPQFAVIPA